MRKVALYYTADLFSLCRQVLHFLLIFVGKYFDCCHCKVSASRWELAASCCSFYIGSINRSSDHAALSILACYECKLALIPMQKHNVPVCARTLSPLQMFKTWLTCCLNLCFEALQRGMTQACSMLSHAPSQLSMQSWQSGGDSLGFYSPVHQLMFQAQLSLHLVCVLWAQAGWTHSVDRACQCLLVFTSAVYSALYLAVCTISSGGFDLQQSSFHPCELVLATAGWIQKEDVFRESRAAEKSW